jgi:hypothetical protein
MRIATFFNHETLMGQVTLLRDALRSHLAWHGARLSFVAAFLIALLRVKSVNLSEWATALSGKAQTDSHGKRLQRFLGVVHEGVAFPWVWCLLDKHGNSNSAERMKLINQFLECFGDREIACLTADRGFVGKVWFEYLLNEPLTPFRLRIRENHKLSDGRAHPRVSVLFANLSIGQTTVLRHQRQLWGHWGGIAAMRLEDNSRLVVATQSKPKSAISDYAKRWLIETLFGIFKTRRFCLESTHLTDSERLSKLLALLSLAFCWVFLSGEWLHQLKPLTVKKHGRRVKSIFRYGFDYLRSIVLNLEQKMAQSLEVLQLRRDKLNLCFVRLRLKRLAASS